MREKISKNEEKPEELILAKQLIDECKYDEAEQLLKYFERKGGHTLHDIVLCHILKCKLLFFRGLYIDVAKLAEQTYKESLGLGKNLLSVDALTIMADALVGFSQLDKIHDRIKQGEELLKSLTQELPAEYKQREAYLAFVKGRFYQRKNDADQALKHFEHSLALREELGIKHEIAFSLGHISNIFLLYKGNFDRALKYRELGMTFAKESGNKWCIGYFLWLMAILHSLKGELDHSIMLYEQSLTIFNDFNNKSWVAYILNALGDVYRTKGDLDRALECTEQSLAIFSELGRLRQLMGTYDLIKILIDKGDLERAQISLHDLEQLNRQLKDKTINVYYLLAKALLLKKSSRTRNRAEAEEILRQILEDEESNFELILTALTNLCELLLIELRMTKDLEVLEEINPLITRLLDIAEKSGSHSILCETFLLKARLSLLDFDIKKAQRFLTQAQQIAERFGLNLLEKKVASENEDLIKKLDLWEELKEAGASMADRLELARLDEKIVNIVYNRALVLPQVTEMKVAISKETKICLVCRGEVLKFSYICECGANYCENCARALANLENLCWACDVPIDSLKPVKPYKKEAESVKVEEKAKN
jgi:tetratricopeptide (TPR) repeat protein